MKKEVIYNKLVRDKICGILSSKGVQVEAHVLSDKEYEQALHDKLIEEVKEFCSAENPEQYMEELADVAEVIHALLKLKGQTFEDLEKIRKEKLLEKGGFSQKIFIEKTIKEPKNTEK